MVGDARHWRDQPFYAIPKQLQWQLIIRWVILRRVWCLVVVLVLVSASLHVEVSVKLVRLFLGIVTGFLEHVRAGGGE